MAAVRAPGRLLEFVGRMGFEDNSPEVFKDDLDAKRRRHVEQGCRWRQAGTQRALCASGIIFVSAHGNERYRGCGFRERRHATGR